MDEISVAIYQLKTDEDTGVRSAAVDILGKAKNPTEDIVSSLIEALEDNNDEVRAAAATYLGRIKTDEVASALIEVLEGSSNKVFNCAAKSLARMKNCDAVKEFIATQIKILENAEENAENKSDAAFILGLMDIREATSILIARLTDEHPTVVLVAATSLTKIIGNIRKIHELDEIKVSIREVIAKEESKLDRGMREALTEVLMAINRRKNRLINLGIEKRSFRAPRIKPLDKAGMQRRLAA